MLFQLPGSCSVHPDPPIQSRQAVQETPTVNVIDQLDEELANGAGPSTASRQSKLVPAPEAAPSSSYGATKSGHEPQEGGFAATQADSDQHDGGIVPTKPLSDRQVPEPSASQSASAASAQTGAQLDQHSAAAAEPASHATDQVTQKAPDALTAKDKPAESSAAERQPASVLGSAPHHLLPETDQTTSSAKEHAVSEVQAEGEQSPSALLSSSSQVLAVPSVLAETPYSPAAVKASGGSATASMRSEGSPSATPQGSANVPTAAEFTAVSHTAADTAAAAATTAGVPTADPIPEKAARSPMAASQGTANAASAVTAGQSSDRGPASPKSPQAPSSGAPATADAAFALPEQATQAETVRISPIVISDSAGAAPSTGGDVEKQSSLAPSPSSIAEADSASSATQETENAVANSPVGVIGSRAAAGSPRSTEVAASKSPVTVKASQSLGEEEEQRSGFAESRATPSFPTALSSLAGPRGGAVSGAAEGQASTSSPSAQISHQQAKPHATADAAEGRAAPCSPSLTSGDKTVPSIMASAEIRAPPGAPSSTFEELPMSSVAALAKARASPGDPAAYTGAEAEPKPSATAPFFDVLAAARLSKAIVKGLSNARAAEKKSKARAAPRGLVAEFNNIAAKHAASHADDFASSPASSALSSLTVKGTAQRQSAAHKPGKPAVTPVFAMTASSGGSAAAPQATASRASATDKLTARQSAVLPPPLPDQATSKSALAPPADASLWSSAFGLHAAAARSQLPAILHTASSTAAATADHAAASDAQHVQTGSPPPLNAHKLSSTSAAAADHAAASGTQLAQTSPEPKPATASEGSDDEGHWEVVPGAEHLKQLKDAKARRLASGATCTIRR